MNILLLLITFLWNTPSIAHDVPLAIFQVRAEEDHLALKIRFIREDLEETLLQETPALDLSDTEIRNELIENYLGQHLRWLIDGKAENTLIDRIEADEHHILIVGRIGNAKTTASKLEIWNTCLLGVVDGHSNIVHSYLHDKERAFRMSEKRQKIVMEY